MKPLFALLTLLVLALPARAYLVTIGFDEPHAPHDYSSLGIWIEGADRYHDGQGGIVVDEGPYRAVASPLAVSPPNIALPMDTTHPGLTADSHSLFGLFTRPGSFQNTPTDFASLWVVPTGPADLWQLTFFALTGDYQNPWNILATVQGPSDQPLLVSLERAGRDISGFSLTTPSGLDGIDDVTFNAPVPEPGTWLLAVVAAVALAFWAPASAIWFAPKE